ncbi:hypothetical protein [Geothrix sp. 21YS21S-4]|uniref:hypothetical protein n=1 Tax=Geothrix sp. 21YS21S-4 TaxID=3068889 RepID=UPI0027B908A6|nr:hypothetical protein [Geothrix sp. 21YS21S-4]
MNPDPHADPYVPYLRQAEQFFADGELVKAGQIWQAILKQQPTHTEARERLVALRDRLVALREKEAAAAAPEPPLPAPPPPPAPIEGPDRLVAEGCTLYDMGQAADALRKWEEALARHPLHPLARTYAASARRELGLPPLEAAVESAPAPAPIAFGDDDAARLLREAVQLYDMGLTEEAIAKWERVLVLEPHREEIQEYLRQAREELGREPAPAVAPPSVTSPGTRDSQALDLKLRQADHLLSLQRREEAAFTYQQALALAPGHPRALEGLARCGQSETASPASFPPPVPSPSASGTGPLRLDTAARNPIAMAESAPRGNPGVEPPAALLQASPPPRGGLFLPGRLKGLAERLPWRGRPRLIAGLGGGAVVLLLALVAVHGYRKDQGLKEAVRAARDAALAPIAQQAQAPDLVETPEALREEAEAALGADPVRAYLRAQALAARLPDQPQALALLEKSRAGLAGGAVGASLPEFQKHLQTGDLEAATRVMDALLRAQPDDPDLRARAARLQLLLCAAHAGQTRWDAAADDLRRGRALFPGDKAWQARLRLLEHIKGLPKPQQAKWASLLG